MKDIEGGRSVMIDERREHRAEGRDQDGDERIVAP